jgi:ABC-type multidrug transport system fused ATPase/permease subunit
MNPTIIQVSLTEEDLYQFQKEVMVKNIKELPPIPVVVVGLYFVFIIVMMTFNAFMSSAFSMNIIISDALILFGLFSFSRIPSKMRKSAAEAMRTNEVMRGTIEYEIGLDQLKLSYGNENIELKVSNLYTVRETDHYFGFYSDVYKANIIPKRLVQDEAQMESLRTLQQKAPKPKKAKSAKLINIIFWFVVLMTGLVLILNRML